MPTQSDPPAGNFPVTNPSLIQRIQSPAPTESSQALEEFFSRYWLPCYSFLRACGESHEDASDLVQDFVSSEILRREQLSKWDPAKGKLRSFLKTCLDRFRKKHHRRETAEKRGGNHAATHVSMDFEWAETYFEETHRDGDTPDRHFDREWAAAIVNQAVAQLADRYKEKSDEFDLLLQNLQGRGDHHDNVDYETIATRLSTTIDAVKQRMKAFRTRFEQCLRQVVKESAAEGEIEDEVSFLRGALGR